MSFYDARWRGEPAHDVNLRSGNAPEFDSIVTQTTEVTTVEDVTSLRAYVYMSFVMKSRRRKAVVNLPWGIL